MRACRGGPLKHEKTDATGRCLDQNPVTDSQSLLRKRDRDGKAGDGKGRSGLEA